MGIQKILSAGIDIGTSTTQLIFSRIFLEDTGGFGKIPQIKIMKKEIIYQSAVYFTPLLADKIDGKQVAQIIKKEYENSGIQPKDLSTGAVIITGETSRKRNAEDVVHSISELAGDFVVSAAGADLESVLAGKGAGAAEISKKTGKIVANLDIGGGTTNISVFQDGEVLDTACLDIGGRLIKLEDGKIKYIAPKIKWLSEKLGLSLEEGTKVKEQSLRTLTENMAEILARTIVHTKNDSLWQEYLDKIKTNHLLTLPEEVSIEMVMFSGGVAACFNERDTYKYGDIGVLLAQSIQENLKFKNMNIVKAKETIRATVIGAGNYSMNISGSTIEYARELLPAQNIPVVRILLEQTEDIAYIEQRMHKAIRLYKDKASGKHKMAIAMRGISCPGFREIQEIAERIIQQYDKEMEAEEPLIIILEEDISKALGQALFHRMSGRRKLICIDGIHCENGDFIDLGEPVASGTVIPVIVKTLIFNT